MDAAAGILILIIALAIYFIPTVIAAARGHRNAAPIIMINLLLGWTFVGWLVALIWSMTYQPPELKAIERN